MPCLPSDRENYLVVTKTPLVASELTTAITGPQCKMILKITTRRYLGKFG